MNKKAEYERQLSELRSSKEEKKRVAEVMMQSESDKEAACTELKDETKKSPEGNPEDSAEASSGDKESKEEPKEEEAKLPTEDELSSEFQKLCNEELELTEFALLKNSKSYSAWNHRLWILSLIPKPDFQREFRLNELYLQKDGRNRGYL